MPVPWSWTFQSLEAYTNKSLFIISYQFQVFCYSSTKWIKTACLSWSDIPALWVGCRMGQLPLVFSACLSQCGTTGWAGRMAFRLQYLRAGPSWVKPMPPKSWVEEGSSLSFCCTHLEFSLCNMELGMMRNASSLPFLGRYCSSWLGAGGTVSPVFSSISAWRDTLSYWTGVGGERQ